jgi:hypothetical protein
MARQPVRLACSRLRGFRRSHGRANGVSLGLGAKPYRGIGRRRFGSIHRTVSQRRLKYFRVRLNPNREIYGLWQQSIRPSLTAPSKPINQIRHPNSQRLRDLHHTVHREGFGSPFNSVDENTTLSRRMDCRLDCQRSEYERMVG